MRPYETFHTRIIFYGEELLAPRPTSKLEDHPWSAVSYPPYLEAVFSVQNPRPRRAMGTRGPLNRMLRRIYVPKREEMVGVRRKRQNEWLHNLYSLPNVIRMNKSKKVGQGL
jgi:hypothetical protein